MKLSAEAGYAACMQTIFSSDVMALQAATYSGFLPVIYAPQNGKVAGRRCDSVMVFKWLSDDARKVGSNTFFYLEVLRTGRCFVIWSGRAIRTSGMTFGRHRKMEYFTCVDLVPPVRFGTSDDELWPSRTDVRNVLGFIPIDFYFCHINCLAPGFSRPFPTFCCHLQASSL